MGNTVFLATPPTRTDGQSGEALSDQFGNTKVVLSAGSGLFASGSTSPSSTVVSSSLNVIPLAIYNATASVRTEGQGGPFQADSSGNVLLSLGTRLAGEDIANDVIRNEEQFTGVQCTADTQVKASAGFLHCITFMCTDAAPTAGSIIVYDNTAESGTVILNLQISTTFFNPFTVFFNRICTTGIYVGFTTTADVAAQVSYR